MPAIPAAHRVVIEEKSGTFHEPVLKFRSQPHTDVGISFKQRILGWLHGYNYKGTTPAMKKA